jgi:hypothetical protein
MDQRVVTAQDWPDSKPDPREKPVSVRGPDEFVSKLGDEFVNPTQEEVDHFKSSTFVGALRSARYMSEGFGHTPVVPHVFSLVMQFGTAKDATDAVDTLHLDSLRPCPQTCAEQAEEFEVSDIPGARGTHRFATQESIQQTGDSDETPFDGFEVQFSDGVFAYRMILNGQPGKVTQDEAEEIAKSLYDRVKGRPPA